MDQRDEMRASIARLDAMIERAKGLPSLPDLAHGLQTLIRQRELLRFWEKNAKEE